MGESILTFKQTDEQHVDVFDGPIFIAQIFAHEKHIAIISKYLEKVIPDKEVIANLVRTDWKPPPGVEIDFLV